MLRHILRGPDRSYSIPFNSTRGVESVRITRIAKKSSVILKNLIVSQRQHKTTLTRHRVQRLAHHQVNNNREHIHKQLHTRKSTQHSQLLLIIHVHQHSKIHNIKDQSKYNNHNTLRQKCINILKVNIRANHSSHSTSLITMNIIRHRAPSSLNFKISNLTRRLNNHENLLRLRINQTNSISRNSIDPFSTKFRRQQTSNSLNNLHNTILTPHKTSTRRHNTNTTGSNNSIKRISVSMQIRHSRINSTLRANRRHQVNNLRNISSTSHTIKRLGRPIIKSSSRNISLLTRILSTRVNKNKALQSLRHRQPNSRNSNRHPLLVHHTNSSKTHTNTNTTTLTANRRSRINALRHLLSIKLIVLHNLTTPLKVNTNARSAT